MILDFTIKNYKSFKEASTLSLLAESLKNEGIAISKTEFNEDVLPVVGTFGQNAGGKSNLIKALVYMQQAILNSNNINFPVNSHPLLQPYLLNLKAQKEPIHFEIALWDKKTKTQYNYGFEVGAPGVVAEWLELVDRPAKKRRSRLIFERSGSKFEFDSTVKQDLEHLKKHVLDTALAVNVFANLANKYSIRLIELIKDIKIVDAANTEQLMPYALDKYYNNEKLKLQVANFIKNSDIAINEVDIDRSSVNLEDFPPGLPEEFKSVMQMMQKSGQPSYSYRVTSRHDMYDDKGNKLSPANINFNFAEQESLGTQKVFALSAILLEAINNGETVVLDELGSSLHPFLSKKVVELFQNPKTNKNGAQLIFTSHETFLLSKGLLNTRFNLRRDQIWFADKGEGEASVLRRLSEFKTKKEYELSKRYLEGRFGAVPVITFEED